MFCRPTAESVSFCCPRSGLQPVASVSALTHASIVQAELLAVGRTGSVAPLEKAYPAAVEFLSQALSTFAGV